MATLTLAIPDDLKQEMDEAREISWSEVARAAIKEKLAQLRLLKAIVAKSKLTQFDADALARKITGSLHKRYGTGS